MYVDTNVILRALLNDHPEHSPRAQHFFKSSKKKGIRLETSDAVVAEVFYVLESSKISPQLTRDEIAELLVSFIQLIDLKFAARDVFTTVLAHYREHSLDITDLLLVAQAEADDRQVVSFDKGLDKLNSKIRLEP
jgi:predicted nucleic acid-binding protein